MARRTFTRPISALRIPDLSYRVRDANGRRIQPPTARAIRAKATSAIVIDVFMLMT